MNGTAHSDSQVRQRKSGKESLESTSKQTGMEADTFFLHQT